MPYLIHDRFGPLRLAQCILIQALRPIHNLITDPTLPSRFESESLS